MKRFLVMGVGLVLGGTAGWTPFRAEAGINCYFAHSLLAGLLLE